MAWMARWNSSTAFGPSVSRVTSTIAVRVRPKASGETIATSLSMIRMTDFKLVLRFIFLSLEANESGMRSQRRLDLLENLAEVFVLVEKQNSILRGARCVVSQKLINGFRK